MEENFLVKRRIRDVSMGEVVEAEQGTRDQAKSTRWQQERRECLTVSCFGELCKVTEMREKLRVAKSFMTTLFLRTTSIF